MAKLRIPYKATPEYIRQLEANGSLRRLERAWRALGSQIDWFQYVNHRLGYAIWSEICSCRDRIRFLRTRKVHLRGLDLISGMLQSGHPLSRIAANSHSDDISAVFAILPSASLVDVYLFSQGWSRGAEWGLSSAGTSDFGTEQTEADTCVHQELTQLTVEHKCEQSV